MGLFETESIGIAQASITPVLIEELKRRHHLCEMVDAVIRAHLIKHHKRTRFVKRGIVHRLVAERLGLVLSNKVRQLVNRRMHHLGFELAILYGQRIFRRASLR